MCSTTDPPELLVAREVAALLRIKVSTVYAAAAAGKIPSVKLWVGTRKSLTRFPRPEIERLAYEGIDLSAPGSRRTKKVTQAQPSLFPARPTTGKDRSHV